MNLKDLISEHNWSSIKTLNDLLKQAHIDRRVELTILDTPDELGVILSIPSIFNDHGTPFELTISENTKTTSLTTLQIIDTINNDLEELFRLLIPEFTKFIRIKKAFNYAAPISNKPDNQKIINYKIELYYTHDKHN